MTRAVVVLCVVGAAACWTLAVRGGTPDVRRASAIGASCPVTIAPQRRAPPGAGFSAAAFNYGNTRVRVALTWPEGTLRAGILPDGGARAIVNPDGSIYAKLGWWRGVPGRLVIRGRRLDAHAPPLRGDVGTVASYGDEGFVPSGITFPTVGCWRVVGSVAHASLAFVVKVTKLKSS